MDQGSSQISVGARVAAVAALAVALAVLLAALAGALSGEEGGDSSSATTGNGASTEVAGSDSGSGPAKYKIQEGDTLSAIADETGVSVARIEQLNPGLDPQAITPGQTIRLR